MCEALKNNEVLEELSLANTSMGDFVAANLSAAIESNTKLLKLNIESNNVSPQCLVKIFEVICYFCFLCILCSIFKWEVIVRNSGKRNQNTFLTRQ